MRKLSDIGIVLVVAMLVPGMAITSFAVIDSPDTPLVKSAGTSAILAVLVAVPGAAMGRKMRKGEFDELSRGPV